MAVGWVGDFLRTLLLVILLGQLLREGIRPSLRRPETVLAALIFYVMLAHLHSGSPRFRTHVQPYICILGAGAAARLRFHRRPGPTQLSPTNPSAPYTI